VSKKTKITIAGGSKIYSRPVSTLRKKNKYNDCGSADSSVYPFLYEVVFYG